MAKLYKKTLNKWTYHKIPAQKSMGTDNYRISLRDLEGKFTKSGGAPEYILSNQLSNFKELEKVLKSAEIEKRGIRIEFVKKWGKKFINNILFYGSN